MRAQPRQHLLDIWRAAARASLVDGEWKWGSRVVRNSVSDAEQLLCLMYPASEVKTLKLDRPDETAKDVLEALSAIGDSVEIPRRLVRVLSEYMRNYEDENGAPQFGGGSYYGPLDRSDEISEEQRALPVVESFSVSLTLTLATLGFVRVFRSLVTRSALREEVDRLEELASTRLTAAMVGLLRSFTVNVFDVDSDQGKILCGTANQTDVPDRLIVDDLKDALKEVRAGLRDLSIGSGQAENDLDNPNQLFECGWSWSVVRDAPKIETTEDIGPQFGGVAPDRPSLYFTVNALSGILDLTSERTRVLRLLNEEQQRLAAALQLRYDLTRSYWATLATLETAGQKRWPLEDIPWRTSDSEESDYFTLLMTSLVSEDLDRRRETDAELSKIVAVFTELASRGRITRRALANDPAVALHAPGLQLKLVGSKGSDDLQLTWIVSDYAAVLLKRLVGAASLARSEKLRRDLLELADDTWTYLRRRQLSEGTAKSLWDQPAEVFPLSDSIPRHERPSWYYTERIVESLVLMANLASSPPLSSEQLAGIASSLVSEAEQLFDQELLRGSMQAGPSMRATMQKIRTDLRDAGDLADDQPGTASALAMEVLRSLHQLKVARQDAGTK